MGGQRQRLRFLHLLEVKELQPASGNAMTHDDPSNTVSSAVRTGCLLEVGLTACLVKKGQQQLRLVVTQVFKVLLLLRLCDLVYLGRLQLLFLM